MRLEKIRQQLSGRGPRRHHVRVDRRCPRRLATRNVSADTGAYTACLVFIPVTEEGLGEIVRCYCGSPSASTTLPARWCWRPPAGSLPTGIWYINP